MVAAAACRPAEGPDSRDDAALRARVLMLHRPQKDEPKKDAIPLPGAADHEIAGNCTGSVIDAGVLTAAHCTYHDAKILVHTPEGKDVSTKLVRLDARLDVALLEPESPLPASLKIPLARSLPPPGSPVASLGTTRFGFQMFARGTSVGRVDAVGPRFLVDMLAWPGLSGGPIVARDGSDIEIVGVATGWLSFDSDGHARMLEIAPIDRVRDFLDRKIPAETSAAAAYATVHREDSLLTFNSYSPPSDGQPRRIRLTPHLFRRGAPVDATIDLTVKQDGHTVLQSSIANETELELPFGFDHAQGVTIEARGPNLVPETFVIATSGWVVPEKRLRFDVKTYERAKDDAWLDFEWSARATEGFRGHAVVLRPLVLHGTDVVGVGDECFYTDVDETTTLRCGTNSGRVWAPTEGTYDVLLMSGSTPVGYVRWEIPGPS